MKFSSGKFKFMKMLWISVLSVLFLCSKAVFAIKIADLYQVELPIIAQSQDMKDEAIKTGFLQVLIKLTGDPLIDKNPLVKISLQKADYYVQEFSYSLANTNSAT